MAMWSWDICADTVSEFLSLFPQGLLVQLRNILNDLLSFISFQLVSVLSVATLSTSHPLSIKQIHRQLMIMGCPLLSETVVTSFTLIVSSVGSRQEVFVLYATKNGTLQRSSVFLVTANSEFEKPLLDRIEKKRHYLKDNAEWHSIFVLSSTKHYFELVDNHHGNG